MHTFSSKFGLISMRGLGTGYICSHGVVIHCLHEKKLNFYDEYRNCVFRTSVDNLNFSHSYQYFSNFYIVILAQQ